MEMYSILGGLAFGIFCLIMIVRRFTLRIESATPSFRYYLMLSIVLGLLELWLGIRTEYHQESSTFWISVIFWQMNWAPVSIIAIFMAPLRLAALPLAYLALMAMMLLSTLVGIPDSPSASYPQWYWAEERFLGFVLAVASLVAYRAIARKRA